MRYWSCRYDRRPVSAVHLGRGDFNQSVIARTEPRCGHLILGFVQIFTKRAAQGIAECEQALALDRNLARAHALIGLAKFFLGRGAETEAHVNEAFRLSPRDTFAHRWMLYVGLAKAQLGADAEAVIWMRRSLDANRNYSARAFRSRGRTGAARRAGRSAGRRESGTCARSKFHHPPLS